MIRALILSLFFGITACGVGDDHSQLKSVAWDGNNQTVVLFYAEGGKIYRAVCDESSVWYDRAHCNTRIDSVSQLAVRNEYENRLDADIEKKLQMLGDIGAKITSIDTNLLQYFDVEAPEIRSYQSKLDRITVNIAVTTRTLRDLEEQIFLVSEQLANSPSEEYLELREQLRLKREVVLVDLQNLKNEYREIVEELFNQHGAVISDETFQQLKLQRNHWDTRWKEANVTLAAAVDKRIKARRIFGLIQDNGFSYEIIDTVGAFEDLRPTMQEFEECFNHVLVIELKSEIQTNKEEQLAEQNKIKELDRQLNDLWAQYPQFGEQIAYRNTLASLYNSQSFPLRVTIQTTRPVNSSGLHRKDWSVSLWSSPGVLDSSLINQDMDRAIVMMVNSLKNDLGEDFISGNSSKMFKAAEAFVLKKFNAATDYGGSDVDWNYQTPSDLVNISNAMQSYKSEFFLTNPGTVAHLGLQQKIIQEKAQVSKVMILKLIDRADWIKQRLRELSN